jgi:energy-coupling factor transport system ATP-binding protein
VILAGALVSRPDVLLLDEPTSMLDAASADAARDAIMAAVQDRTLIVVEHRFGPWLGHVDRIVALGAGGLVRFDGTVAAFLDGTGLDGVWMPGAPSPDPLSVAPGLVAPADRPDAIRARAVEVTLASRTLRGTSSTRALADFTAGLEPATLTAFVGPSGAGKSTALAVCGGLQRIDAGTVTPDRSRMNSRSLAADVGWVPQNPEHGFLTSTVADEVVRTGHRLGRAVDVEAVLAAFGLSALAGANPFRLSGGEQRRLSLAAAVAHRPGLLLLDEPTVGQDPATWSAVVGWMNAARDNGAVVALSTHDPDVRPDAVVRFDAGATRCAS